MHPTLTPLALDVDFRGLAESYEVSGGDIRNAVLKAALAAASEPGPDTSKAIEQRHLQEGIREVVAGKRVMRQSMFDTADAPSRDRMLDAILSIERSVLRRATLAGVAAGAALLFALAALATALLR
jgi:hypothetical protein